MKTDFGDVNVIVMDWQQVVLKLGMHRTVSNPLCRLWCCPTNCSQYLCN